MRIRELALIVSSSVVFLLVLDDYQVRSDIDEINSNDKFYHVKIQEECQQYDVVYDSDNVEGQGVNVLNNESDL
ncbi:hypothetical protein C1N51_27585 (plasmid) [Vibrio campbellii]|nr:hypothetical protein C1N51_27585 [Vibrio campbellii]